MSTHNFYKDRFVFLGLPNLLWTSTTCHWQITGELIRLGINAAEMQYFHTMLPELLSANPYVAFIHSQLLDLSDTANCDRATLIKLAMLFPQNRYLVWDNLKLWAPAESAPPENLEIWTNILTVDVTRKLINLFGNH